MSLFQDKTLLITGGTGSFGNAVLNRFLKTDIGEIRIFSRDEKKQDDMRHEFQAKMPDVAEKIKFYIGDVRDLASVKNAMHGVDFIFHAAALKQVPSCEFFPMEAVRTNVIGTDNVLTAAIEEGETYDVEYTVYDLDGYKAYGYINNITGEAVYNVSDYLQATLENHAASTNVRIGKGAGTKEIVLLVAAYNGNKLVSANLSKKAVDSVGEDFTVAVDANGADSIKTFLWNGKNLMPIK